MAQSHLPNAFSISGAAAEEASLLNVAKTPNVKQCYDLIPIAANNMGPINQGGVNFVGDWQAAIVNNR